MKTLKQKLRLTKEQYRMVKDFSHYSNNLYNVAIYISKCYFQETGKYIGLKLLESECKKNENYKLLPSQSAQQIIRLVDKNYRSFFALLRKKNQGQYTDKINSPKFKEKGGTFNIIYTFQNCKLKNNILLLAGSNQYRTLTGIKNIQLKFTKEINGKIKQIIVKPINKGQYFEIHIQYEENKQPRKEKLKHENYLSIDLGINNLCSCFNSKTGHSFLMNGKPLKSYNQWFNKNKAKIQSELEQKQKKKWSKKWSKKLQNMTTNRKWYIDNYLNQTISKIIKYCLHNEISNIVMGYNQSWKQNSNINKLNNQKFQSIPYLLLKQKLEYKCNDNNINFIFQEEGYTSKCSFLDNEEMIKKDDYLGQRLKRGLFKSQAGKLINADINGSANILRKVIPNILNKNQGIVGLMFNPIKINPLINLPI